METQVATTEQIKVIYKTIKGTVQDAATGRTNIRILDVGSGHGYIADALELYRQNIVLSDIADCRDASCRDVPFALMDAHQFALRDSSIDIITYIRTVWHLRDLALCLKEARRVLRPRGRVIVHLWGEPNNCTFITLGAALIAKMNPLNRLPEGALGPFSLSTGGLSLNFASCGFTNLHIKKYACNVECQSVQSYWSQFRIIAETAFKNYGALAQSKRGLIDEKIAAFLTGNTNKPLCLEWYLCTYESSKNA